MNNYPFPDLFKTLGCRAPLVHSKKYDIVIKTPKCITLKSTYAMCVRKTKHLNNTVGDINTMQI